MHDNKLARWPVYRGKRVRGKRNKKKKKKEKRYESKINVLRVYRCSLCLLVPSYARHGLTRERKRESRGDLFQSGNKTRETNWRKYFFGRRGNRYSAEFASVPVTMQWLEKGRIVWQFVKWLSIKRFFFFFYNISPIDRRIVIFRGEEIYEKNMRTLPEIFPEMGFWIFGLNRIIE